MNTSFVEQQLLPNPDAQVLSFWVLSVGLTWEKSEKGDSPSQKGGQTKQMVTSFVS